MSQNLAAIAGRVHAVLPEASAIAMDHFRGGTKSWEKSPGQVLTEADLAIDRLLRERLQEPGEAWLSEETADDGSRLTQARCWVVDPIDGTRSFAQGLPEFAISIGYLVDHQPVFGLVANPASEEIFEAAHGKGAWLNGSKLERISHVELTQPRIAASRSEVKKRPLSWLAPKATWTMLGSLALKLVFVAARRFDAYVTLRSCNDWDIAAADAILREVGVPMIDPLGATIRYDQERPSRKGLIAAAAPLQTRLLERMTKAILDR